MNIGVGTDTQQSDIEGAEFQYMHMHGLILGSTYTSRNIQVVSVNASQSGNIDDIVTLLAARDNSNIKITGNQLAMYGCAVYF